MAAAKDRGDAFMESVYNGSQLAYKVSMNSVYGFAGASKGFLPCVPIAASVTATGRAMIQQTKQLVESLVPGSRVVYGDTDSTMCIFNLGDDKRHDIAAHFEVAERVAKEISQTFPSPVELEFEKVYFPYLLFSKKRYAGNMYISPDAPSYIDVKGLQLVRRDNAPIVKEVSKSILDAIMNHKSRQKATDVAREFLERVLDDEFPIEQYIVSKSLRTGYKNDAQPHVHVSRKILQRTGQPVPSGSRVPYVFVEDLKNPDCLQALKAEDPGYAAEHRLKLDYLYYIDHQLTSPITSLLEILGVDVTKEIFQHVSIEHRIDSLRSNVSAAIKVAKRIRKNVKNNQQEITCFFQA